MAAAPGWRKTGMFKGIGLPIPSGQHRVGCVDVMPLSPGEESGLLFRLYYPTEATPNSGYHYPPWLPNKLYAKGYMLFKRYSSLVAGALGSLVTTFCGQNIPALYGAPVKTSSPLPVVMFSHGVAGMRTTYSATCCDLASHGYLVAAIEHRDRSSGYCYTKSRRQGSQDFVDEWIPYEKPPSSFAEEHHFRAKQLVVRRKEIKLGIDFIHCLETGEFQNLLQSGFDFKQFKGNLDLEHIVMMGQSFGGTATVTGLADDKRFKVGLALDAYMIPVEDGIEARVEQPLLLLNTWTVYQWPENMARIKSLVDTNVSSDKYSHHQLITLRDTIHMDQCDIGFIIPGLRRPPGSPDVNTVHTVNMTLCHAFLKRHLWKDTTWPVRDLDESDTDSSGIVVHGTNVKIESKEV